MNRQCIVDKCFRCISFSSIFIDYIFEFRVAFKRIVGLVLYLSAFGTCYRSDYSRTSMARTPFEPCMFKTRVVRANER